MSRHRFDLSSLIAAVVFLGIAMRYLAGSPPTWVLPGIPVALGVVLVFRVIFRARRREPRAR
ncbi:hypothetical protein GCM10023195_24540 [Actinoallomurus liliacearum]|uniref:PEP-CTERM protein-sorting domain-containing protein n=1 Tax=Actinoallomurus liliacearum TaxID=1080073 RepID=A0ABP8TF50_9ACTN